ncbi:MAG: hypothetical protein ACYDG6_08975 [Thermincolia bacterium]
MPRKKKTTGNTVQCPVCDSKNVGKIKPSQYFCRECYSELDVKKGKINVYSITTDGGLKDVDKTA